MSDLEYHIRTDLMPGDIGYITYLHGMLYAKEKGWDYSFEAYVAGPLAEFALNKSAKDGVWIVESSGKVCGSLMLKALDGERAQLRWFLLDPCLRGKGVGKLLISKLVEFARHHQFTSIELWTVKELDAAGSLYRKFGFNVVEEQIKNMWGAEVVEQKYIALL